MKYTGDAIQRPTDWDHLRGERSIIRSHLDSSRIISRHLKTFRFTYCRPLCFTTRETRVFLFPLVGQLLRLSSDLSSWQVEVWTSAMDCLVWSCCSSSAWRCRFFFSICWCDPSIHPTCAYLCALRSQCPRYFSHSEIMQAEGFWTFSKCCDTMQFRLSSDRWWNRGSTSSLLWAPCLGKHD